MGRDGKSFEVHARNRDLRGNSTMVSDAHGKHVIRKLQKGILVIK